MDEIIKIRLGLTNTFLLRVSDGYILIDGGVGRRINKFLRYLDDNQGKIKADAEALRDAPEKADDADFLELLNRGAYLTGNALVHSVLSSYRLLSDGREYGSAMMMAMCAARMREENPSGVNPIPYTGLAMNSAADYGFRS